MIPAWMMKPAPRRRFVDAVLKTMKSWVNCLPLRRKVSVMIPWGCSIVLLGILIGDPVKGLMSFLFLINLRCIKFTDEHGSSRASWDFPSIWMETWGSIDVDSDDGRGSFVIESIIFFTPFFSFPIWTWRIWVKVKNLMKVRMGKVKVYL